MASGAFICRGEAEEGRAFVFCAKKNPNEVDSQSLQHQDFLSIAVNYVSATGDAEFWAR